jgi:hypothetical protein
MFLFLYISKILISNERQRRGLRLSGMFDVNQRIENKKPHLKLQEISSHYSKGCFKAGKGQTCTTQYTQSTPTSIQFLKH